MRVRITCRLASGVDGLPDLVHTLRVEAPDRDLGELQGALDVARDAVLESASDEGRLALAVAAIAQIADGDGAYHLFELLRKYPDECSIAGDYDVPAVLKPCRACNGGRALPNAGGRCRACRGTGLDSSHHFVPGGYLGVIPVSRDSREREQQLSDERRAELAGLWRQPLGRGGA